MLVSSHQFVLFDAKAAIVACTRSGRTSKIPLDDDQHMIGEIRMEIPDCYEFLKISPNADPEIIRTPILE